MRFKINETYSRVSIVTIAWKRCSTSNRLKRLRSDCQMKQELLTPRQKTKPQLELTRTERFKNGATRNLIANDYI